MQIHAMFILRRCRHATRHSHFSSRLYIDDHDCLVTHRSSQPEVSIPDDDVFNADYSEIIIQRLFIDDSCSKYR